MSRLSPFFQDRSKGERVIGTYLYPYRLITDPDWNDEYSATEVVATARVDTQEILVTRNGGLFVRPPVELSDSYVGQNESTSDFERKVAFEERTSKWLNTLICEFALFGIVSEPATPVHISRGVLIDNHALVTGGGGGREFYPERSIGPIQELTIGTWRLHSVVDRSTTDLITQMQIAGRLSEASDSLPGLVAGAYSAFSKRHLAEAVVDSWVVVEQLVDWYWTRYVNSLAEKGRKQRLADPRTFSAAVRIEVLQTANVLPEPMCEDLHAARRHRNELAHRGNVTGKAAEACLAAMCQAIEVFTAHNVAPAVSNVGVTW
jgi:hypothetical protein